MMITGLVAVLVQEWKRGEGYMGQLVPRYVPDPPLAEMPQKVELPKLSICVVSDNVLLIPPAIRQEFLCDAVRSAEWRSFLKRFDSMYGLPADFSAGSTEATDSPAKDSAVDWEKLFPEEPRLSEKLKESDVLHTCPVDSTGCAGVKFKIVGKAEDEPKLFVCADSDCDIGSDKPFMVHGQGGWVIDQKATAWLKDGSVIGKCQKLNTRSRIFSIRGLVSSHPEERALDPEDALKYLISIIAATTDLTIPSTKIN